MDTVNDDWVILTAENPTEGKCLYTIRREIDQFSQKLHTLVTIEWKYKEMDEQKFPCGNERKAIYDLDEWMDDLDESEESIVKVLMITGLGLREWSFYTTDFQYWIERFNVIMANKPKVPINITHSHDPNWEYWYKFAKHANA